jgi:hypothetical protein
MIFTVRHDSKGVAFSIASRNGRTSEGGNMNKRKSEIKAIRKRRPLSRREMIGSLAVGAGVLAVSGVAQAQGTAESQLPQWVSWNDGIAYPVHDIAEDGSWIVKFDDGFFAVDPAGFVYDSGVWYAVTDQTSEGFWFSGDDGYEYLLVSDVELEYIDEQLD